MWPDGAKYGSGRINKLKARLALGAAAPFTSAHRREGSPMRIKPDKEAEGYPWRDYMFASITFQACCSNY